MSSIDTSTPEAKPGSFVNLDAYRGGHVSVSIGRTPQGKRVIDSSIDVTRDDFLESIRAELNVTTFDNADLPDVKVDDSGSVRIGNTTWYTLPANNNIESIYQDVLERIALMAHLAAHPPVDPRAKVLAGLMDELDPLDGYSHENLAARLIATGRVGVKGVK